MTLCAATVLAVLGAVLWLAGPSASEAGAQGSITVQFGRSDYNVREGTNLQPTLTFSSATASPATFSVTTTAGTATAGADFAAGPHSVTVPANSTSHTFDIAIGSDAAIENDETFTITIASPPPGFTLGTNSTASIQIVNVSYVHDDWGLTPDGLDAGDQFRLLIKTDSLTNAHWTDIGRYDSFVRARVGGSSTGHADIRAFAPTFRVVGSTAAVDAAWHSATGISVDGEYGHTLWSTPVYWLAGPKLADDHNDFWDGTWDGNWYAQWRNAKGERAGRFAALTGTMTGTTHETAGVTNHDHPLGAGNRVVIGGGYRRNHNPIFNFSVDTNWNSRPLWGMSGVFEVTDLDAILEPRVEVLSSRTSQNPLPRSHANAGEHVRFAFDAGYPQPGTVNGIRTELAWSGDVLSEHRPTTYERPSREFPRGRKVRPHMEGTLYRGDSSYNRVFRINTGDDTNGWIAMRLLQSDSIQTFPGASDWTCVAVGNGTCPSMWPGKPAATVMRLDGGQVQAGSPARFRVSLSPAPAAGETRRVYVTSVYQLWHNSSSDQHRLYGWVDVDSSGSAVYERPTELSRNRRPNNKPGDWILRYHTQIQPDIAYSLGNRTTDTVDVIPFTPASSEACWYGHSHHPRNNQAGPITVRELKILARAGKLGDTNSSNSYDDNDADLDGSGTVDEADLQHLPADLQHLLVPTYLPAMGQTKCLTRAEIDTWIATYDTAGRPNKVWTTCKVNKHHTHPYNDNDGGTHNASAHRTAGPTILGDGLSCTAHPRNLRVSNDEGQQGGPQYSGLDSSPGAPFPDPGALIFSEVTADTMTVSWPKRSVDHYIVRWAQAGASPEDFQSAQVDATNLSYTISGLQPSTLYVALVQSQLGEAVTTAGYQQTAEVPAACTVQLPADAVTAAEVTGWRDAHDHISAHVLRWNQVLAALGDDNGATPMTVTESKANESRFMASRWNRVTRTLEALAQCDHSDTTTTPDPTPTTPDPVPDPAPEPEISVTGSAAVAEGDDATYTVTADPAPASPLTVTISVSQNGDYATTGPRTVIVPATGSVTVTVATIDDSTDEPDGSITATIDDGTGYSVSTTAGSATVTIKDDDDPPPPPPPVVEPEISIAGSGGVTEGGNAMFTLTATPAPTAPLTVDVSVTAAGDYGVTTGSRQVTIATTGSGSLTATTSDDSTDEPDGSVTVTVDDNTGYSVSTTADTASVTVSDDDDTSQVRLPPGQVSFSIEDASATEGETLRFPVRLSNAANKKVRVWWTTRYGGSGHRAFPGRDYPNTRGWLTFNPGDTEQWVDMPLPDDTETEPSEVFQIYLGFAEGGAVIADRDAAMTIIDND